jgi:hypothetical protein
MFKKTCAYPRKSKNSDAFYKKNMRARDFMPKHELISVVATQHFMQRMKFKSKVYMILPKID